MGINENPGLYSKKSKNDLIILSFPQRTKKCAAIPFFGGI